MLQSFESNLFIFSAIFIFFGLFAIGWLIVHIEHGRHLSMMKVVLSGALGAVFLGFGIHFLLLYLGM